MAESKIVNLLIVMHTNIMFGICSDYEYKYVVCMLLNQLHKDAGGCRECYPSSGDNLAMTAANQVVNIPAGRPRPKPQAHLNGISV